MQNRLWVVALFLFFIALLVSWALSRYPRTPSVEPPSGRYAEQTGSYDILAEYATSTPLVLVGAAADAAAVATMHRFVTDSVAEFKSGGVIDRQQTLQILYLTATGQRTVSYIYTVYADTGGAHGNTYFRTFAFDTATGEELTLADFFLPGAEYLARLSTISRARLPAIIGEDFVNQEMLDAGTTPDGANFERFFIGGSTMGILFPPYQIAPYAAGPQTLPIPLAELADILKPEYRP